ncbi:hypothetical protein Tco_0154268 [Tanacetum coccineum]
MRQAEGMGRPVHHGKRIRSYSRLLCSINAQWKGMLVGSEKLTSVPEAKKEEQEQEVVPLPASVVPQILPCCCQGDPPHSERLTGPAVRSNLYANSYGADRFTTSARYRTFQAETSFARISLTPREDVYLSNNKMEP